MNTNPMLFTQWAHFSNLRVEIAPTHPAMGVTRVAHAYERSGTPLAGATVRAAQNARSGSPVPCVEFAPQIGPRRAPDRSGCNQRRSQPAGANCAAITYTSITHPAGTRVLRAAAPVVVTGRWRGGERPYRAAGGVWSACGHDEFGDRPARPVVWHILVPDDRRRNGHAIGLVIGDVHDAGGGVLGTRRVSKQGVDRRHVPGSGAMMLDESRSQAVTAPFVTVIVPA
jgi:hypothetical protein